MDDTVPATPPAPTPAPRPRTSGSAGVGLAVLLALVALGGSGYLVYRWQRDANVRATELDALRADQGRAASRIEALSRELATSTAAQRELERKLADAAETNRSVREELLGLGERARLVEDAVSNLAEQSLGGATALKLNEAEFLLRMGTERLRLFDDTDAALEAYRLADAQLADIDDPVLSGVRQSLASEIETLAAAPKRDWNAAIERLDAMADASAEWPARAAPLLVRNDDPDATMGQRIGDVLSRFVRIRRVDDGSAALINPLNADAARAAAILEIEIAKAALAARDADRATVSLDRARQRITGAFDDSNPAVRDALASLATLRDEMKPVAPPVLGASLEALTNLRRTQAVRVAPADSASELRNAPATSGEKLSVAPAAPGAASGDAADVAPPAADPTSPPMSSESTVAPSGSNEAPSADETAAAAPEPQE